MAKITVPIEIDMDSVIDKIIDYLGSNEDVVEVVRCRECKHFLDLSNGEERKTMCLSADGIFHPDEDDYCSKGEKWSD